MEGLEVSQGKAHVNSIAFSSRTADSMPVRDRLISDERSRRVAAEFYQRALHRWEGVFGSPRVVLDLREDGETTGRNWVVRINWVYRKWALRAYKALRFIYRRLPILRPLPLRGNLQ